MSDVRQVLDTAAAHRGALVDVTIKRDVPPTFVLTCQWDNSLPDPVWALYEGQDGSKVCWTYPSQNLEMIFEIICMSLPGGATTPGTAASLAGLVNKDAAAAATSGGSAPAAAPPPPPPPAPAPAPTPAQPYPAPGPAYPPPPGQPMPQGGYPPGYPPPGYPQQPAYPPGYAPPPGYPGYQAVPPGQYPPGYGQAPYPQPQQPGYGAPPPYPQAPPYPAAPPGSPGPVPASQADMQGFIELLNKGGQNQMMLGHLFVEAGVLPEPCVDAALKLQELVRKGMLSNSAAIEALRRAAEHGGVLDDETILACRTQFPNDSLTNSIPAVKVAAIDPREFARQTIQLIQQAGIVTENDIATAEGVRKKHGGDVATILVAAGKLEKSALEAARRCQPLVREHRLNHEEAYRILRHCQKNKTSVDDAFQALSIRVL